MQRSSLRVLPVLAASLALSVASPARAMVINPIYDSSITGLSNASVIEAAFNTVARDYASLFSTPATVNIAVSWGSIGGSALPSNAVGASLTSLYGYYTYAQVKSYLTEASRNAPSNTALASAVANLPASAPAGLSRYAIPAAEAKALGIVPSTGSARDASIGFAGRTLGFDFNPADGITSGTFDFQAVAAHELDEVLGRISGLSGRTPSFRTPFDLFRYSAPGVLSFSYASAAYFSLDGGRTSLGAFNNASAGDRSDLLTLPGSRDIQDAFISPGQRGNLTASDLAGLDALGWGGANIGNTNTSAPTLVAFALASVPEPASFAVLGAGLLAIGLRRARKAG